MEFPPLNKEDVAEDLAAARAPPDAAEDSDATEVENEVENEERSENEATGTNDSSATSPDSAPESTATATATEPTSATEPAIITPHAVAFIGLKRRQLAAALASNGGKLRKSSRTSIKPNLLTYDAAAPAPKPKVAGKKTKKKDAPAPAPSPKVGPNPLANGFVPPDTNQYQQNPPPEPVKTVGTTVTVNKEKWDQYAANYKKMMAELKGFRTLGAETADYCNEVREAAHMKIKMLEKTIAKYEEAMRLTNNKPESLLNKELLKHLKEVVDKHLARNCKFIENESDLAETTEDVWDMLSMDLEGICTKEEFISDYRNPVLRFINLHKQYVQQETKKIAVSTYFFVFFTQSCFCL